MPDAASPANARYVVGFTGGSGCAYGVRLVEVLLGAGHEVHVAATAAAVRVLHHERGVGLDPVRPDLASLFASHLRQGLRVHTIDAVDAAPASGTAGIRAVILCPCSMGTLARVACGFSSNLLERAADVAIKEGRQLVVVPRETPLSVVHLQNMLALARLGVVVLPAMPGFYHRPRSVEALVDFVVGKILDRLGVPHTLVQRWQTPDATAPGSPWHEGEEG